MQDWWTYTLSDFLLFSPRTYYRTLERHNASVWPVHILTLLLGVALAALVRRSPAWQGRVISITLALLWLWITWAFLWQRYAPINWAVTYLIPLLALEILLLLWMGVLREGVSFQLRANMLGALGGGLLLVGLLIYPILSPLFGRGWSMSEAFGVAPDPTVIATLGLLLLIKGGPRGLLLLVPLAWCAISAATLWAMRAPEAWILSLSVLLTVIGAARSRTQREASGAGDPKSAQQADG
jgi:hypothetical protein